MEWSSGGFNALNSRSRTRLVSLDESAITGLREESTLVGCCTPGALVLWVDLSLALGTVLRHLPALVHLHMKLRWLVYLNCAEQY